MTPDPTRDQSALRWVRGELDETLRQARLQLEDFVEDEVDSLDECMRHLHQAHGVLELVEVYGGAMLADELEKVARALNEDRVDRADVTAEVLMMGMVQLPAYLERIEGGQPDIPLILLPLMNDLRASRKAPLVSEISLFAPKLDSVIAAEEVLPGSGNPALSESVLAQRPHYHRGLLNWFREVDVRLGLSQMRDVIERLSSEARTSRLRRLLDASEALVVALQDESLEPSVAVKLLFGQLDRVFKRILDQGEEAVARDFPLELLKNQLYYIARSGSEDPVVMAVRRSADLANSFPDMSFEQLTEGQLGEPGQALFDAVSDALRLDLRNVKDQLDLYMRGSHDDFNRLDELVDPIHRMADTLGMVGRGELRSRLMPHCDQLQEAVANSQEPDDEALMDLAGDLLYVESALASLADAGQEQATDADSAASPPGMSDGEYRQHVAVAIEQVSLELTKTKDAILEYLSHPSDTSVLRAIPGRLGNVSGALRILDLSETLDLLEELRTFVVQLASGERGIPEVEQKEALADLVSGVEYYVEWVVDSKPDQQHALEVARAAAARLVQPEPEAPELELTTGAEQDAAGTAVSAADEITEPDSEAAEASPGEQKAVTPAQEEGVATEGEQAPLTEAAEPQEMSEPAAEQADSSVAPPPLLDDIDSEILEIFVEEAKEELQAIREHYPRWRDNPEEQDDLVRIRRAFHTLKGSGRLVGALEIGEFAWSVENLLNRVIEGTVTASSDIFALLDEVVEVLPALVDERERGVSQGTSVGALQERAFALASPGAEHTGEEAADEVGADAEPRAEESAGEASAEQEHPLQDIAAGAESAEPLADASEIPADLVGEAAAATVADESAAQTGPAADTTDTLPEPEATAPSGVEVEELAPEEFEKAVSELSEEGQGADELVLQGLDEDLPLPISEDSEDIELTSDELVLEAEGADSSEFVTDSELEDTDLADEMPSLSQLSSELPSEIEAEPSVETADDALESILTPQVEGAPPVTLDPTLFEIFVNEGRVHLATIEQFVENCRGRAGGCEVSAELKRAVHTLRGSANMAEIVPIASIAQALERWLELLERQNRRTDAAAIDMLERGQYIVNSLLLVINKPGAEMPTWQPFLGEIEQVIRGLEVQPLAAEPGSGEGAEQAAYDPELLEIFVEDAAELTEGLDREFETWRERPDDLLPVAQLQRHLHTIKGGARLAGVMAIGNLSHAMESLFESIVEQRVEATRECQGLARHGLDALAAQIEALQQNLPLPDPGGMVERLEAAAQGGGWEPVPGDSDRAAGDQRGSEGVEPESLQADSFDVSSEVLERESAEQEQASAESGADDSSLLSGSQLLSESELLEDSEASSPVSLLLNDAGDGGVGTVLQDDSRIIQFPPRGRHAEGQEEEPVRLPPPLEEEKVTSAARERVRVRAELLDQMVNNAGEVSIYRARLEQQNKTFGYNLEELAQTIERLRGQLRSLELETEAQILSRYEREYEAEAPAGFDPLEMDRYSTIQQLSRALGETVNDLSSIGLTLAEMNRDSDTLLLQQERVNNDLQDGLLRTRMVPVSSRTARLQRVVRQTAHNLGKLAELSVIGGDGEMDRAILERMMAPLEHLLRNAVAHGIELPEERKAADKPESGTISLVMSREGADVVLTVSDDGRGLDRESIRAKAVERGLIEADAEIKDDDLDQLILEAGFSTADEVSQIAGRGVGMDVVLSEVKQLGGSLELGSQPGRGSSFTIRLPFTLAITESLLVTSGEEVYAVPHSAMDGVVRISRADLEACYRGERESFTYAGRNYSVRYLGSMLNDVRPLLPESERWFPLLLIRSGEHRVAIHVDSLLGNRQIVVKSLGAQLATVRWFTGGTILADGRIALILDINSLVRLDTAQHPPLLPDEAPEEKARSVTVMVVDDSITVRKVTTRLLERHNMQVITAKDGVDAVAVLQDEKPDVMLLDIEMPRMDGFEVARHMRSIDELSHIPIIMITSRTGDKHRGHATELGVKRYLGKPYQEAELLENIYTVLAEREHD